MTTPGMAGTPMSGIRRRRTSKACRNMATRHTIGEASGSGPRYPAGWTPSNSLDRRGGLSLSLSLSLSLFSDPCETPGVAHQCWLCLPLTAVDTERAFIEVHIQADGQQDGVGHKRRPPIAHKGEREADHRHDRCCTGNIDGEVDEEDSRHTDDDQLGKGVFMVAGHLDQTDEQHQKQQHDDAASDEPELLADHTEDKVGPLLRQETELGLGPLHESFSGESSGSDRSGGLDDVPSRSARICTGIDKRFDPGSLLRLQDMVQSHLCTHSVPKTHTPRSS